MKDIIDKIIIKEIYGPIIIFIAALIINAIAAKAINKLFKKRYKKLHISDKRFNTLENLVCNIIKYFVYIIALVMILNIFGVDTVSIITSLGVVGVVAGLALQDILKDFISGLAIVFENQYSLGDIVTIAGFKGEVIYLGIKTTRLRSYSGEEKIIANHLITEVVNHSNNSSLAIVDFGVSYDSDMEKVEKVIGTLCTKMSSTIEDLTGEVTLCGVQSLDSSCVTYRITALTKPEKHYMVQRKINKMVKEELDKNDIEIPFNQVVIHNGK